MNDLITFVFLFLPLFCSERRVMDSNVCWYPNREIKTSYNDDILATEIIDVYRVEEGKNIVFEKKTSFEYGTETYTRVLLFEVDAELEVFKLVNQDILKSNCLYYSIGGAGLDFPDSADFHISKGLIQGKKISKERWDISVDIEVDGKKVDFNDIFHLCEQ